jgi:ribosomal protein S18 acetylase RimI-like enzyme
MGRVVLSVRRVDSNLYTPFIDLWVAHRIETGTTSEAAQRLALDGTLQAALERPDVSAFVAFVDGRPAGYIVLGDTTRSLLVESPSVTIDMLYVSPELRRQGVARALLSAAARYADRQGAEQITSSVPAQDREANRFFARLGFCSETVRRVTTSVALQRRLAGHGSTRYSIEQVLQRRRDVRSRVTPARPPQIAG